MLDCNSNHCLITGGTGFIGAALVRQLLAVGYRYLTVSVRRQGEVAAANVETFVTGDLSSPIDWSNILRKIDTVIHLAGRAHMIKDASANPLEEFRKVNTNCTLSLARQSEVAGVRRFVFISSVGVNGSTNSRPFLESDRPEPEKDYARSKYEAEQGLLEIARKSKMEVVIIRPPLVYGPNAPGNFQRLLELIARGVPLPFGKVVNKRSFIALDNLVDFISCCIDHPRAAGEVFLISDGEDISTTNLLKKIAISLGKRPKLIAVPAAMMMFVARCIGKDDLAASLLGSLRINSFKARELLGWSPVITMDKQLAKTANIYLTSRANNK